MSPDSMQSSEAISKLVCRSIKLKSDSYLYRNDGDSRPYCDMCQDFALENAEHLVIHCSYFKNIREHIFLGLSEIERSHGINVFTPTENNFHLVMLPLCHIHYIDILLLKRFPTFSRIATHARLIYSCALSSYG